MPRRVTVTFADGSSHVYENAPDDVSAQQIVDRATREFNKPVKALDGGRGALERAGRAVAAGAVGDAIDGVLGSNNAISGAVAAATPRPEPAPLDRSGARGLGLGEMGTTGASLGLPAPVAKAANARGQAAADRVTPKPTLAADGYLERQRLKIEQSLAGIGAGLGRSAAAYLDGSLNPASMAAADFITGRVDNADRFINAPVQGDTSWEDVKAAQGIGQTIKEGAKFVAEQGPSSLAYLPMYMSPAGIGAYGVSLTGNIAQDRAENNGGARANMGDILAAAPAAAISTALDKFGFEYLIGEQAGNVALRIGKAALAEGLTEGVQNPIEYAGGSLGTGVGFDAREALDQGLSGALVGAGAGGAFRGGFEAIDASGRLRGRRTDDTRTPGPGIREQAISQAGNLTPEDLASPLHNADIVAGRTEIAKATAGKDADAALSAAGLPKVGTKVSVAGLPGGNALTGTIEDVFSDDTGAGVVVRPEGGGKPMREYLDTLNELGVSITAFDPLAEADAIDAALAAQASAPVEGSSPLPTAGAETPSPRPSGRTPSLAAGGGVNRTIVEGLKKRGFSEGQALGIAAGIHAESASNPNARNPSSGAMGVGQWLGPRKDALRKRFGDNPTLEQQLDFLADELRGGDAGGKFVLAQSDPAKVLDAYIRKFMRPAAGAETDGDIARGMAALGLGVTDGGMADTGPLVPEGSTQYADLPETQQQGVEVTAAAPDLPEQSASGMTDEEWDSLTSGPTWTIGAKPSDRHEPVFDESGNQIGWQDPALAKQFQEEEQKKDAQRTEQRRAEAQSAVDKRNSNRKRFTDWFNSASDGAEITDFAGSRWRVVEGVSKAFGKTKRLVAVDNDGNVDDDFISGISIHERNASDPDWSRDTGFDPDNFGQHPTTRGQDLAEALGRDMADTAGPQDGGVAPTVEAPKAGGPEANDSAASAAGAVSPSPRSPIAARTDSTPDVAVTATGSEIPVNYAVVEMGDLVASNTSDGNVNPAYPADRQPRDRTRAASQTQIAEIASRLNPRLLGRSPKASDGAPIISPDGIVESGNGRTLALQRVYGENSDNAKAYRQFIESEGFDTNGMKQPVLVRIRDGNMSAEKVQEFVRDANVRDTAGMSGTETAASDAAAMPAKMIDLYRGGDIEAAGNRDFVKAFVNALVPTNERASMILADGSIAKGLVARMEAALLVRAFGERPFIEKMVDATDSNIRAIGKALVEMAGKFAKLREAAQDERVDPEMDITGNIAEAVEIIDRARREGKPIGDYVNQRDIFSGTTIAQMTESALRMFFARPDFTKPHGQAKLVAAMDFYVEEAMKAAPGGGLFGESTKATPDGIIQLANERNTQSQPAGADLFSAARETRDGADGARVPDAGRDRGLVGEGVQALAREESGSSSSDPVAPVAVDAPATNTPARIDDFGEQLVGARKDVWQSYKDKLNDAAEIDVAAEPLSKTWPEPDYQKLLDGGADPYVVAWVHAARDEIPTKPQKGWKLKGWAENVRLLRDTATKLLNDEIGADALVKRMSGELSRSLRDLQGRVDLYRDMGHSKSLKGVTFSQNHYSLYRGERDVTKWVVEKRAKATAFGNWPREIAVGDTREEALAKFKAIYDAGNLDGKQDKIVRFDIYSRRGEPGFMIGKKVGKDYVDLKRFDTAKEARDFKISDAGYAELVAALDGYKDIPPERKASNAPRIGIDHRSGADVKPEAFAEAFGFRGVQFGNYVEGERRQSDLNEAYDALMDLAGVIGIPARALSLNGELGLAFGARGKGGKGAAAAHFEPDTIVINLTKNKGAGSLAHEWWHSLDNYFSRMRAPGGYMTEGKITATDGVRPEMVQAFKDVMTALRSTSLKERSKNLDKRRTKEYWATDIEMSARAFESYVIAKLQDEQFANDYLANVVSEEAFGIEDGYPYLRAAEIPPVRAAFDEFFNTVETRETERGLALRSLPESEAVGEATDVKAMLREQLANLRLAEKIKVRLVDTLGGAAGEYRAQIVTIAQDTPQGEVFTLNHEAIHALRDLGLFNTSEWAILSAKAKRETGLMRSIRQRYEASFRERGMVGSVLEEALLEEAVADMFARHQDGRYKAEGTTDRLFKMLRQFFEAVRNAFAGRGLRTAEGVMQDVAAGEVGARNRQGTLDGSARQSVADVTDTEAFKRWFGNSKVVDENGQPMVVHHWTYNDFTTFDPNAILQTRVGRGRNPEGVDRIGNWFSSNPEARYASPKMGGKRMDVFLLMEKPFWIDENPDDPQGAFLELKQFVEREGGATKARALLKDMGYDGIILSGTKLDQYDQHVFIVFEPEQIKSATDNNGAFDPSNPDIRFSIPERDDLVALGGTEPTWKAKGAEAFDRWRTAMQDRYLPLLKVQRQIEEQTGKSLPVSRNPYMGEELMTGRIGARLERLAEEHVQPLFDAMHAEKITTEELESFLYARHAPERNARIAEINPDFTEGEGSGMTDLEAAAIMSRVRKAGKMEAMERLAARVDQIRDNALDYRVQTGLISKEDADEWRSTYQFYVPLRGFKETGTDAIPERMNRSGGGINVRGRESRQAFGRRSQADSPLAYLILQAEEAIVRGETNIVAARFYNLAKANPDKEFWSINKTTERKRMNEESGLVESYLTHNLLAEDKDWTVSAKINGREVRVTMNKQNIDARRLADAMRNLTQHQLDWVTLHMGKVNRFLSAVNTSYNPEFIITNAFRDLQTATFNLSGEDVKGLVRGTLKDYRKALAASAKGAFGKQSGEWGKWYDEFTMNGGRVYFNKVENVEEIKKRIASAAEMAKAKAGEGGPRLQAKRLFLAGRDMIENLNNGVENAVRLSVYKNAREAGLTPAQAASMAKNVTVNFNRRGTAGPAMNAAYLFFNASVQGSARILMALRSPRVRKMVAGVMIAAAAAEMLNAMMTGDDDDGESFYDKIPAFEKSRNIVLMLPDGKSYIKIPMPYGYNAFWEAGRSAAEIARRGGDRWLETMGQFVGTVADAFNPIGGSDSLLNILSPTITDPIVDLTLNKDFTGKPIMPNQSPYGPDEPDNQRYFNSVGPHWKTITEFLNASTGGDEVQPGAIDVSPETLEYLSGTVIGSAGAFVDRIATLVGKSFDESEEVTANDIPLARKLYGDKPGWVDKAAFYDRLDAVETAIDRTEKYLDAGNQDAAYKYAMDNKSALMLEGAAKQAKKDMREVRKAKNELETAKDREQIDDATYRDKKALVRRAEDLVTTEFNAQWIAVMKARRDETGGD